MKIFDYIEWNKKGIIPGPTESEEEYVARAHACLNLSEDLKKQMDESFPLQFEEQADKTFFQEVSKITLNLFDVFPDWIPIFFSNYQLAPWHGGCAWIVQLTENSPITAFIQLRAVFKRSKTFLSIYNRDELVSHEVAHTGRMAFQEKKFEEFLAYRASRSAFRQWFGPIFQSSTETFIFLALLLFIFGMDVSLIALGQIQLIDQTLWIKAVPVLYLVYLVGRLWYKHSLFNKCLLRIKQAAGSGEKANAIIYRLTDSEITFFAKRPLEEMEAYIKQENSLRWQVIKQSYLSGA